MLRYAVMLCCYNRKDKTLACLESLLAQQLPVGVSLDIFLLDDGSSDGTSTAVAKCFPQVKRYQGSGQMYWNGAMTHLWQQACKYDYDAYIWLNDDVQLHTDALARLHGWQAKVSNRLGAMVGSMHEPGSTKVSYGGRRSLRAWHPLGFGSLLTPAPQPIQCDFINGNLCFIPKAAVETVGILDKTYTHALGDFDYGLRLKQAGFYLYVAPGLYGQCASNSKLNSVFDASLPMTTRLSLLNNPARFVPVDEWMHFVRRHGGLIWPLLWLKALMRKVAPRIWLWRRGQTPADLNANDGCSSK